jgi:hypothetical protein
MTGSPHTCTANVSKHDARTSGAAFRNTVSGRVHAYCNRALNET